MAQAVCCRRLDEEAHFRFRACPCGFCDGCSGAGASFTQSTLNLLVTVFPSRLPHSYFIHLTATIYNLSN